MIETDRRWMNLGDMAGIPPWGRGGGATASGPDRGMLRPAFRGRTALGFFTQGVRGRPRCCGRDENPDGVTERVGGLEPRPLDFRGFPRGGVFPQVVQELRINWHAKRANKATALLQLHQP